MTLKNRFSKIIEESKLDIPKEKHLEWENFCYKLYNKNQLREVAVEIVEDSMLSMKLLSEGTCGLDKIIEKVGRSWNGGISCCLLELIIEKFYKNKELFKKEVEEMQRKNAKCKKLDDVMKKIR